MSEVMIGQLASTFGLLILALAPVFLALGYFFIVWDKRRPDSHNADDTQVGLKLALFFLAIVGLGLAASGASGFLHYLLSGTKIGSVSLKTGIASLLSGVIVMGGVRFVFLPRTNVNNYPQTTRFALGYVTVLTGFIAALSLSAFASGLFTSASWPSNSGNFGNLIVFGGLAIVALMRFGALSGWTAPPPRQAGGLPGQGGYSPGGFPGQGPQGQGPQGGFPGAPQGGFPGQQDPGPQGGFQAVVAP